MANDKKPTVALAALQKPQAELVITQGVGQVDINALSDNPDILAQEIRQYHRDVVGMIRHIAARIYKIRLTFDTYASPDALWKRFCADNLPFDYDTARKYLLAYQNLTDEDYDRLKDVDQSKILLIAGVAEPAKRQELIQLFQERNLTKAELAQQIKRKPEFEAPPKQNETSVKFAKLLNAVDELCVEYLSKFPKTKRREKIQQLLDRVAKFRQQEGLVVEGEEENKE
jgi:hypothetical protein